MNAIIITGWQGKAIGLALCGLVVLLMWFGMRDNKCRFWKRCKLYKEENQVCNNNGGLYYHDGYPGCYRLNEKNGKYFTK